MSDDLSMYRIAGWKIPGLIHQNESTCFTVLPIVPVENVNRFIVQIDIRKRTKRLKDDSGMFVQICNWWALTGMIHSLSAVQAALAEHGKVLPTLRLSELNFMSERLDEYVSFFFLSFFFIIINAAYCPLDHPLVVPHQPALLLSVPGYQLRCGLDVKCASSPPTLKVMLSVTSELFGSLRWGWSVHGL